MSKTGVIVALVVALLLAAAVFFVGGKRSAPPAAGPLLAFDPAKVVELRVERPDGRYEAVRRGGQAGLWYVALGESGPERVWPADAGRMRAALRILSTLESDQQAEPGAAVEKGAPQVRLSLEDQSARTMRVSARTLAGSVLVEVSGLPGVVGSRAAWVGADVGAMLVGTGPKEWRDRSALPGLGPDASRITLKGEKGTISLARIQGRWGLRAPVQEVADSAAVAKLLAVLGNILVEDFLDNGPPDHTGLDRPVATLSIESDQRDADGKVHTSSRTLSVGQQADIAGKSVFAALTSEGDAVGRVVTVSAEGLAGLTTDPSAYVSRQSVQAPAADIGGVSITPADGVARQFRRDIEGWSMVRQAGAAIPCSKADADAIGNLLELLAQMPAESVAISVGWPPSWAEQAGFPVAAIDVASAAGTPIAKIDVLSATFPAKGKTAQVVIQSGDVWRVYAVDASSPLVSWLRRGS